LEKNEREGTCYFPGNYHDNGIDFTQQECQEKCDAVLACEQAVFRTSTKECYLGLQTLPTNYDNRPNSGKSEGEGFESMDGDTIAPDLCYARRGFNHPTARAGRLKQGFAGTSKWVEGWASGNASSATVCSYPANHQAPQHCSHWTSDFRLSPEGCWAKCDMNSNCTQAVWTKSFSTKDQKNVYDCRIGTMHISDAALLNSGSWVNQKLIPDSQAEWTYIKQAV
jgi:hypothetical protein